MAQNDRTVSLRTVSWWAVTVKGSDRASSVHRTQDEAIRAARLELLGAGGGELTVLGADGEVQARNVVQHVRDVVEEALRKSA